jgi:hypothetical protein
MRGWRDKDKEKREGVTKPQSTKSRIPLQQPFFFFLAVCLQRGCRAQREKKNRTFTWSATQRVCRSAAHSATKVRHNHIFAVFALMGMEKHARRGGAGGKQDASMLREGCGILYSSGCCDVVFFLFFLPPPFILGVSLSNFFSFWRCAGFQITEESCQIGLLSPKQNGK